MRSTSGVSRGAATAPASGIRSTSVWVNVKPVASSASTDTGTVGARSSLRYVSGGRPSSALSASKYGCMRGGTSAWVRLKTPKTSWSRAYFTASTTSSMCTR